MPRVARRARDVIIRVPKLLPYSKPSHAPNAAAGHEPGTTDPANATDASASAAQTVVSSGTASGTVAGASSTGASSSKDAGPGALIPQGEPGAAGAEGANGASAAAALPQTQHVNLRGETSAAEWNSLLIWARRQRGPQWDTGTATWQVDKHSQEYYSYCSNPTQDILVQLDALNNPQHASTSAGATDTPSIAFNEGGGGGGGVGSFESAHAQQQQPGGLLEAHQISGGAGGGVNPMQMMMIGNAGQQGRDEREDSPPVIAPGRSTRLRNWG
ncbi:hypothetical protein OC846_000570 [Tilletia horrida]|uniref:Uncharacterized protein n=1 Tax=Tilletia horrida TaxID=155126 RepID=A0AAN6GVI8_9BASI|nr:hypothetical protein OC845_000568 [Tilletia horrida]KAK0557351.1 hypothetical protein OC846_000570 [Tilletia horrida]KAK0569658.1 hypothetical protein OC861_000740 [Tilletia horrida]